MSERTSPCKQCNNFDFYYRGNFSYCRVCHKEAQKRYAEKSSYRETVALPKRDLTYLLSSNGKKGSHERNKLVCPQGHPYDKQNTKINSGKKGKTVNRKCRACDRNYRRKQYGLDPEPAYSKLTDMLDD